MTQVSPVLTGNYGPQDWLAIAKTKSESLYKIRESALAWWAQANGFQDPELLFSLLKRGEQDPYQAAKKMVDLLTEQRAKTTAATYRSVIQTFYKFSDIPFKEELFDLRVPAPIVAPSVDPEALEPDEIHSLLGVLDRDWQGIVLFLVNTGWRISEPYKVRVRDLHLDEAPARVKVPALDEEGNPVSKTRRDLNGFLARETRDLLQESTRTIDEDELIFFGMNADKAYYHLMRGFKEARLTKRQGYLNKFTVHPHTFRTTFLALVKGWGFDSDWAEALASHEVGVRVSYQNIKAMGKMWIEKVESNMVFLSDAKPRSEAKP